MLRNKKMYSKLDTKSTNLDLSELHINQVAKIDFSQFTQLEGLDISNLGLIQLPPGLPITLKKLICSGNNFGISNDSLLQLPSLIKLEYIDCSECNISSLECLPPSLKILICRENEIQSLDNLPPTLVILEVGYNIIKNMDYLPPGLLELHCGHNPIEEFENLPLLLKILDCPKCKINNLDCIPDSVEKLYCQKNKITKFARLPAELKEMACFGNPFIYPFIPTIQNIENELSKCK